MHCSLPLSFALALIGTGCASPGISTPQSAVKGSVAHARTAPVSTEIAGERCVTIGHGFRGDANDRVISERPFDTEQDDIVYAGNRKGRRQTLLRFDLTSVPRGAVITSAKLRLQRLFELGGRASMHEVTAAWNESDVSWQSFHAAYESAPITQLPQGERLAVDITDMVRSWHEGAPNRGIALTQERGISAFVSSEGALDERPRLEVCYTGLGDDITSETGS